LKKKRKPVLEGTSIRVQGSSTQKITNNEALAMNYHTQTLFEHQESSKGKGAVGSFKNALRKGKRKKHN